MQTLEMVNRLIVRWLRSTPGVCQDGAVREDESRTWKGLEARERRIMRKAAVYS